MTSKEKKENRRLKKYWDKKGRKDFFTWLHRYLRLHNELLADSVYQNLYDYLRNTLVAYLKKDVNEINDKKTSDAQIGKIVDILADIFNKDNAEQVNKYKCVVDELYVVFEKYPSALDDIRI